MSQATTLEQFRYEEISTRAVTKFMTDSNLVKLPLESSTIRESSNYFRGAASRRCNPTVAAVRALMPPHIEQHMPNELGTTLMTSHRTDAVTHRTPHAE
jgi:hypothetical protein